MPFFKQFRDSGKKLPITDPEMTRFWIQLVDGAAFVDRCLGLMRGGEIFIPKIPSMKITDLARAISADSEHEIVGIRPGEKLHELLLTRDDARNTIEFKDYYIINPGIHLWESETSSAYGDEQGKPVAADFEYASNTHDRWFDIKQLRDVIE